MSAATVERVDDVQIAARMRVPGWAAKTEKWDVDCDGTMDRTINGPDRTVRTCKIPNCEAAFVTLHLREDQSTKPALSAPPNIEVLIASQIDTLPEFSFNLNEATARDMAAGLYELADHLAAATGDVRGPADREHGATQRAVTATVRRILKDRGIRHSEFAISIAYDPTELSALMTGATRMDIEDVDRFATALGLDPFELLSTAMGVE
ncbi:MAG: helix-turn-helix transcriptional regulator [Cellulomonas sp.]|nr:helix-turn-helix transcriptional regulator [Cellulomonas sp.]